MVIVCPECTTKFRVNPDRIPDRGAKVRCARCKHIFWAEKPQMEELPTAPSSEPPRFEPEAPRAETTETVETFGRADSDEPAADNLAPEVSDDTVFDYNRFREQDIAPEEESFTFSNDAAGQEAPSTAADEPLPAADEETFSFGEVQEESVSEEADNFTLAEKSPAAAPVGEIPASDDEIASAFTPAEEEPAEPVIPAAAAAEKPKGGLFASIIRILLLLILGILIIGGVMLYMNGPEQLEQLFQQVLGQQAEHQNDSGQIVLENLQGKFINNQDAGELFIIRGEAINKFKDTRASIQVKGVIFDQNGKSLLQKTIFCGNPISDPELQSLPFSKIEELMGNQFGKSLSNMNINQGQTISFVIVFRDLPQSLSEFSVDVTSSKPASQ